MAKILPFPCPHCGNHVTPPTSTRARKPVAPVNTEAMSDAELYAYYKRTSAVADVLFFLSGELSPALRRRAESLSPGIPDKREIASLRTAWRTERLRADRETCAPAVGTDEWFDSIGLPRSVTAKELGEAA